MGKNRHAGLPKLVPGQASALCYNPRWIASAKIAVSGGRHLDAQAIGSVNGARPRGWETSRPRSAGNSSGRSESWVTQRGDIAKSVDRPHLTPIQRWYQKRLSTNIEFDGRNQTMLTLSIGLSCIAFA